MSKNIQEFLAQVAHARRKAEGEYHDDTLYLILKRPDEESETEMCPFCGQEHFHGHGDGHRAAHCPNNEVSNILGDKAIFMNDAGLIFSAKNGYIVKTV